MGPTRRKSRLPAGGGLATSCCVALWREVESYAVVVKIQYPIFGRHPGYWAKKWELAPHRTHHVVRVRLESVWCMHCHVPMDVWRWIWLRDGTWGWCRERSPPPENMGRVCAPARDTTRRALLGFTGACMRGGCIRRRRSLHKASGRQVALLWHATVPHGVGLVHGVARGPCVARAAARQAIIPPPQVQSHKSGHAYGSREGACLSFEPWRAHNQRTKWCDWRVLRVNVPRGVAFEDPQHG